MCRTPDILITQGSLSSNGYFTTSELKFEKVTDKFSIFNIHKKLEELMKMFNSKKTYLLLHICIVKD